MLKNNGVYSGVPNKQGKCFSKKKTMMPCLIDTDTIIRSVLLS